MWRMPVPDDPGFASTDGFQTLFFQGGPGGGREGSRVGGIHFRKSGITNSQNALSPPVPAYLKKKSLPTFPPLRMLCGLHASEIVDAPKSPLKAEIEKAR